MEQVVGEVSIGSGTSRAVLWNGTESIELINPPGAVSSSAYGINNLGEIAGSAQMASGQSHAVVWKDGKTIDLGAQHGNSDATGINDKGQVVGRDLSAVTVWDGNTAAQISQPDTDYNDGQGSEYYYHATPTAINDSGQVAGIENIWSKFQGEEPFF